MNHSSQASHGKKDHQFFLPSKINMRFQPDEDEHVLRLHTDDQDCGWKWLQDHKWQDRYFIKGYFFKSVLKQSSHANWKTVIGHWSCLYWPRRHPLLKRLHYKRRRSKSIVLKANMRFHQHHNIDILSPHEADMLNTLANSCLFKHPADMKH